MIKQNEKQNLLFKIIHLSLFMFTIVLVLTTSFVYAVPNANNNLDNNPNIVNFEGGQNPFFEDENYSNINSNSNLNPNSNNDNSNVNSNNDIDKIEEKNQESKKFDMIKEELKNINDNSNKKIDFDKLLPKSELKRLEKFNINDIKNFNVKEFNVKNILQKREIPNQKTIQITNEYQTSVKNYNNLSLELNKVSEKIKNSIIQEKECLENKSNENEDNSICIKLKSETSNLVKEQISIMLSLMKESFNKVNSKVIVDEKISENLSFNINNNNMNKIIQLDELNNLTNQIQEQSQLENHYKNILTFWNKEKSSINENLDLVKSSRLNSIIVRMSVLENKLNNFLDKNNNLTIDFEEKTNYFSSIIFDAKELFEEAKLDSSKYDLVDEKLKEANFYLIKEILPLFRKNGFYNVDEFLKIEDNDTLILIDDSVNEEYDFINESDLNEEVELNAINPTHKKTIQEVNVKSFE